MTNREKERDFKDKNSSLSFNLILINVESKEAEKKSSLQDIRSIKKDNKLDGYDYNFKNHGSLIYHGEFKNGILKVGYGKVLLSDEYEYEIKLNGEHDFPKTLNDNQISLAKLKEDCFIPFHDVTIDNEPYETFFDKLENIKEK
ncbi:unnamed protein product [Rotaria sp. Silwood1]|nr:unnamed protein product [Rotaria sp. Silwood1]